MRGRRRLGGTVAALAAAAVAAGCGGEEPGGSTTATRATTATAPSTSTTTTPAQPQLPPPGPARRIEDLAARFEAYTGVVTTIDRSGPFGPEMLVEDGASGGDRFDLFWVAWTEDDEGRRYKLGARRPDDDGWYRGRRDDLARAYGPRLVLQAFADDDAPDGIALDLAAAVRAVEAAYEGDPDLLPDAERSCALTGTDPLTAPPGACALDGVPTTFADAGGRLVTDVLEGEVTGVEVRDAIAQGAVGQTAAPGEAFVLVGHRLTNPTGRRHLPVRPLLRVGDQTFEDDPQLTALAGRFLGAIDPGATTAGTSVYRVDAATAARAREEGVLVLPVGRRTPGFLDAEAAQGWIRLGGAPGAVPRAPRSKPAPAPPAPPGPPTVPFEAGGGREIGFAARSSYHASSFFPIPASFQRGGIPVGSRAGACRVPSPTARDRGEIAAMAARADPRDEQVGIVERNLLLAECGRLGDYGIAFWVHVTPKGKRIISGTELVRRGGRWAEHRTPFYPGCGIPLDAAAVWKIDVSHCPPRAERRRPAPKGELA